MAGTQMTPRQNSTLNFLEASPTNLSTPKPPSNNFIPKSYTLEEIQRFSHAEIFENDRMKNNVHQWIRDALDDYTKTTTTIGNEVCETIVKAIESSYPEKSWNCVITGGGWAYADFSRYALRLENGLILHIIDTFKLIAAVKSDTVRGTVKFF